MTSLFDLQSAFQKRLLAGEANILDHLAGGGAFMKVYDHAYTTRLLDVLSQDFPALHTLLGDEGFAEAMKAYLSDKPSSHPSIRWLGKGLPDWLRQTAPWCDHTMLGDMAAFEWALGLAFDAPDAPELSVQTLVELAPHTWPHLVFNFHPALSTVHLSWNIVPFRQAVAEDRDPDAAPTPFDEPAEWAVWRNPESLIAYYRPLAGDEAAALNLARKGGTFSDLCEVIATTGDPETAAPRTAALLRTWVETGWISHIEIEGGSL